jgi:hypothetical protein
MVGRLTIQPPEQYVALSDQSSLASVLLILPTERSRALADQRLIEQSLVPHELFQEH